VSPLLIPVNHSRDWIKWLLLFVLRNSFCIGPRRTQQ
jgi:hypothetical protein